MNLFKGLSLCVTLAASAAVAPAVAAASTAGAPAATAGNAALPYVIAVVLIAAFVVAYVMMTAPRVSRPVADDGREYGDTTEDAEFGEESTGEHFDYAEDDDLDYEDLDDNAPTGQRQSAPMSAKTKRTLVTVAIVAAFILVGVVVGSNATKPQVSSGQIVQTFDGGAPCATVVVPVDAAAAGGPEKAAEALFAALDTAQGINDASFDIASSKLTVGYCSTTTNEGAVLGVLGTTGIVTQ